MSHLKNELVFPQRNRRFEKKCLKQNRIKSKKSKGWLHKRHLSFFQNETFWMQFVLVDEVGKSMKSKTSQP